MNDNLKIFVDADVFVALTLNTDDNHEKAVSLLQSLSKKHVTFLTSNYVFSESITVISMKSNHGIAIKFIDRMLSPENPFEIKRAESPDEKDAINIFKAQASKNTSYVDCLNMVYMKKNRPDAIFSFDHIYKTNGYTTVQELLR